MRITYRDRGVKEYWTNRWEAIPADGAMENLNVYPLKFSEMTIKDRSGGILEAGCGAGRILRYYHEKGLTIVGIDFIDVAVEKLKAIDDSLKVEVGNITDLQFADESFKYILSFGLYHNLEQGLDKAIQETYRVCEHGGSVCASFRADN
ncbi:MAG: class I SAM-dependent methyltransferase, partial [Candidatus Thioglobus sp.]